MKDYNEHWESKLQEAFKDLTKVASGIRCPNCKDGELLANYNTQYLSYPPKYKAKCGKCEYETYI